MKKLLSVVFFVVAIVRIGTYATSISSDAESTRAAATSCIFFVLFLSFLFSILIDFGSITKKVLLAYKYCPKYLTGNGIKSEFLWKSVLSFCKLSVKQGSDYFTLG